MIAAAQLSTEQARMREERPPGARSNPSRTPRWSQPPTANPKTARTCSSRRRSSAASRPAAAGAAIRRGGGIKRRRECCAKTGAFVPGTRRNGPKGSPFVPQPDSEVAGAADVCPGVRKACLIAAV